MRRLDRTVREVLVALLVALLSWVSGARADADKQAQQAFERGVAATHAGRWLDARSEFLRSLELSPKPTAHFNLAVTDLKLGLGEEALRELSAFEVQATPDQHGDLLLRVPRLRQRAEALVASRPPPTNANNGPIEVEGLNEVAAAHNTAGCHAYDQAQDTLALSSFEAAHTASGRAELLFNVGLAADRLRADERAIASYEMFASALPSLAQAGYARARVTVLRAALAARTSPEVATDLFPAMARVDSAHVVSRAVQPRPSLTPPITMVVSGTLMAAGTIGTGLWWANRTDNLDTCLQNALCDTGAQIQREQRAAIATTVILGVVGIGLVVGGAVWLAQTKRQRRQGLRTMSPGRLLHLRF